jgi:hypothetical protein
MKIDQQGTIYNKSSQICAYADDIAIIPRTKRRLIEVYEELEEEAEQMVLIVNCRETKYMLVSIRVMVEIGRSTHWEYNFWSV